MGQRRRKVYTVIFAAMLVLIISVFGLSALRTEQFDPEIADIFLNLLKNGGIEGL